MLDYKKIGRLIATEREKINLTQEGLGKKLFVTRQAVSKWERGIAMPDIEVLLKICKIFNISTNELLAGERTTEINKEYINNISLDVLKEGKKKVKKIIILFSIIVTILIVFFLIYYFASTYNKIRIFKISGQSDNFQVIDTISVFSNETAYLKFSNVYSEKYTPKFIQFYYIKYNEKINIYASDKGEALIIQNKGYNEYFDFDDIEYIINNLYVDVHYEENKSNKIETIKLKADKIYSNKKLIFINEDEISSNKNWDFKNVKDEKIESIFIENENGEYTYNYIKDKKKIKITYNPVVETAVISITDDKSIDEIIFWGELMQPYSYKKMDKKGKVISESSFLNEEIVCISGDCNNHNEMYNYVKKEIIDKLF